MVSPILILLAALTIRHAETPVRSGCEAGDVIGSLPAGTPVEIRFRLADGSDCIKIAAKNGSGEIVGYVNSSALAGLESFDRERLSAGAADPVPERQTLVIQPGTTSTRSRDADIERARDLLAANQPEQALEILEPAVERYRNNPSVLLLAGFAAYRSDQLDTALGYWKQSLDLSPNRNLADLYARVQREAAADPAAERLVGMHIALRYERDTVPVDAARAILGTLDQEYGRIAAQLGCSSSERIVAIVLDRQTYLRSTGAAEWSGGWYDGRIHIAWTGDKTVSPEMRRGLAHELVHACLTALASGTTAWPAWLQEGLAQKLSGDKLDTAARKQLEQLARAHQLPRLEELHPDWSRMSAGEARVAYNMSLAAADALYDAFPGDSLRNVLRNPDTLPHLTLDLDQKLGF
ncbi:MAG TPA: hypothetical protein VKX49_17000 [Bryobacteraceae bacterium]|nr:hypothetical protein [Bryobacteraceae bacterium]